jgi:hypothetical protein
MAGQVAGKFGSKYGNRSAFHESLLMHMKTMGFAVMAIKGASTI